MDSTNGLEPAAAILLNRNAKRVTPEVVDAFHKFARKNKSMPVLVYESGSLTELEQIVWEEVVGKKTGLVGAVGGDGTTYESWNLTHAAASAAGQPMPAFATFCCGTGNLLAGLVEISDYRLVLRRLAKERDFSRLRIKSVPLLGMHLREQDGSWSEPRYFTCAGSGLDAEVLQDYGAFKHEHAQWWQRWYSEGRLGYLLAVATKTVPRELGKGLFKHITSKLKKALNGVEEKESPPVTMRVNDDHYYVYDSKTRHKERIGVTPGTDILKNIPKVRAVVAGTASYYGFNFMAFPYAGWAADCDGGMLHVRVLAGPTAKMVDDLLTPWHLYPLWHGRYDSPFVHDFFIRDYTLGSEYPSQIAGDLVGTSPEVRYRWGSESLDLYDPQRGSRLQRLGIRPRKSNGKTLFRT